jgi:DNA-damage-inducible protein J
MANKKSKVNVKIDTNVKELATQLLEHMGLDQTTAIDMFYRQIITERRLPFLPAAATYGEQMLNIIRYKNIPNITLPADENGSAFIDREQYPELYDWAVIG